MPICLHNGTLLSGFSEMPNSAVLLEDGKIADVFTEKRFLQKKFSADTRIIDVEGSFISPGLIDTHIHGFGGFGTDDGTGESVLEMSERLADYGVTSFIPTLYPQEEKQMLETVKNITSAFGKEVGSTIMGLHLEGPFISPQKLGSLDANAVQPVSIESMKKLYDAANGKIVNMTVAPELKGMRELALYCLKKEIVLQAGHTCAEYDHMVEGMQAGILHSTHIFNAMTSMSHRNPNAAGAILIHPEMSCEIIPDGFHVHPDIIKLLFRDKPVDKIVMITDSLKPTMQAEPPFFADNKEVVLKNGLFHRISDDIIAGSALTMIKGVKNLVSYDFPLSTAIQTATANPAKVMNFRKKGFIIPGYDADVIVFDKHFNILMTVINGDIKKDAM
ncbi:MAG: N-acetylglucosamine-6-phosphate deacetylase [Treponemataceae bacterium]